MDSLWFDIVQWLHTLGLHVDGGTARAVGDAAASATAQLDMPSLLALAAALGWASGFRLYAVVFLVGMMGVLGWMPLPPGLAVLQNPLVLMVSGVLLMVEFFADKVPWLDSAWDAVHAFIRVPAGAALAFGVFGADNATMAVLAGLLGGSLSATALATKMTTRAAVNTSPEPFSNWGLSFFEDGLVVAVVWLATQYPVAFGVALVMMVAVSVLLLVVLFKFLRAVLCKLMAASGSRVPGNYRDVVYTRSDMMFSRYQLQADGVYERAWTQLLALSPTLFFSGTGAFRYWSDSVLRYVSISLLIVGLLMIFYRGLRPRPLVRFTSDMLLISPHFLCKSRTLVLGQVREFSIRGSRDQREWWSTDLYGAERRLDQTQWSSELLSQVERYLVSAKHRIPVPIRIHEPSSPYLNQTSR